MEEGHLNADSIEALAAQWLALQEGEAWTSECQRELDAWLSTNLRHRVAYLRLHAAWRSADGLEEQTDILPVPHVAPRRWRPVSSHWTSRIAACMVLACSLGAALMLTREQDTQRYATRVGESRTIALTDGSRIMLNTGTRLHASRQNTRHVWLDVGEAYFDIAHDATHPFVIEAGASRVRVLGTRFTVRRDGDTTTVLVAQGRVRVSEGGKSVELVRNEETTAREGLFTNATRTPAETEHRLAWREGRLVFDGTTLADAAAEFNRYNERQLCIADPSLGRMAVGGSFAPTNIDGFVRLLEQGFALRIAQSGNAITISR